AVIRLQNWKEVYREFLIHVFGVINADAVYDIVTGHFRMPAPCLDRIRKMRPQSLLTHYPYHCKNDTAKYPDSVEEELTEFITTETGKYAKPEQIRDFRSLPLFDG